MSVSVNHWDNGLEGNYWNDWTSPDVEGDGIVDSPYILDGSGAVTDYYPLTNPIRFTGMPIFFYPLLPPQY